MVSFGWCRGVEDAGNLQDAGFDYIECALGALQLEDKDESKKRIAALKQSPLPVRAFNIFFPGDLKIVGPDASPERIKRYVSLAAEALYNVGPKVAVLGSGGSRRIPDGWDTNAAEDQFVDTLGWIADAFQGTGVTLAIEPLNRKESNLINSVEEAVRFAKKVNREQIRVLADLYHMDEENEPLDTVVKHGQWLAHIHVADTGRRSPGTGQYPYDAFIRNLRSIGYSGMISAECSVSEPDKEFADSLVFLKRKWHESRS